MATEQTEKSKHDESNKDAAVKPEPETLNTTDPQEHMQGPISSLIQKMEGTFDTTTSKKEAQEKRDKEL